MERASVLDYCLFKSTVLTCVINGLYSARKTRDGNEQVLGVKVNRIKRQSVLYPYNYRPLIHSDYYAF